jgi:hypothetical protein
LRSSVKFKFVRRTPGQSDRTRDCKGKQIGLDWIGFPRQPKAIWMST